MKLNISNIFTKKADITMGSGLSKKEIAIINDDLRQKGMDGNKRNFRKPGEILHYISQVLNAHGLTFTDTLTLDSVPEIHNNPTAFPNGNKSVQIRISRNSTGNDPFTPGGEISNTLLYMTYSLEGVEPEARYSAIAYLTS